MYSLNLLNKLCFKCLILSLLLLTSGSVFADIHAQNSGLSFTQRALSTLGNPASAALVIERKDPHVMTGGMVNLGLAVEYGDFDDLFDAYNKLSSDFEPSDPDDGDKPGGGEPPEDDKIDWDEIFEKYPELEGKLKVVKDKVTDIAGVLAIIAVEGYGKAEVNLEVPLVLSEDLFGGTLLFGASLTGYAKTLGIFEDIHFDSDQAIEQLKLIPDFDESDPVQELDLSAGIILYFDPSTKKAKITIDNDSLLLVKTAKVNKFLLSYSKKAFDTDYGSLYWGVKPTIYHVGLTNLGVRVGDITDAKDIFNDIKDADYHYDTEFDVDLGLVWAADHFQFGASVRNLAESSFQFPEVDRRRFSSGEIISKLKYHEYFKMKRQVKLEAAIYTDQRHWSLNMELDANPISDPMKDRYQWLNVSGGYAADSWWLPSARFGFSRNLVGSKLAYITAGVTMMKIVNLDLSTTLDSVDLDGDNYRRGLNISLGIQFDY